MTEKQKSTAPKSGSWTTQDAARFRDSAKTFTKTHSSQKAAREYLEKLGTHTKDGQIAKTYRK